MVKFWRWLGCRSLGGRGDGRWWCGRLVGWVVLGLAYVKALRAGMDHFGLDLREELGQFLYNSVFFIFG